MRDGVPAIDKVGSEAPMIERANAGGHAWTVSSETGRLTDVLLCRPDHYAWQPINAKAKETLRAGGGGQPSRSDLESSYSEMVDAFEQAGVTCHWLEPEPHLAYQVYTRDSSLMTPWGPVITQLAMPVRRGEYAAVIEFYAEVGLAGLVDGIWRYCTSGAIEGGDIHIVRPGLLIIGTSDGRTTPEGAEQMAGWFREQGWEVRIEPFAEHFLHLDVLFCMVTDSLAAVATEAVDPAFIDFLSDRQIRTVPVSYRDAVRLGCNLMSLGDDRVISSRHAADLNARLRAEGIKVYDPDMEVFSKGGGSAHCLTLALNRVD